MDLYNIVEVRPLEYDIKVPDFDLLRKVNIDGKQILFWNAAKSTSPAGDIHSTDPAEDESNILEAEEKDIDKAEEKDIYWRLPPHISPSAMLYAFIDEVCHRFPGFQSEREEVTLARRIYHLLASRSPAVFSAIRN